MRIDDIKNIPKELRDLPQWVVSGEDKKPVNFRTGSLADVTNPANWSTFEDAVASGYPNVGFVLTKNDPYTIIDLDDPEKMRDEEKIAQCQELNSKVFESFNSYAEFSQSGRGVHIIVLGSIPKNVRRDTVEIYSSGHYLICTGQIISKCNLPIVDQQSVLDKLYVEMGSNRNSDIELIEHLPILNDDVILQIASNAANKDKFNKLFEGNIEGYASGSEADFALISLLSFYTQSNEQVRRLFKRSKLGQRIKDGKVKHDNPYYVNLSLKKIRANEIPQIDFSEMKINAERLSIENDQEESKFDFDLPPGLVGQLTEYFYYHAVRPVPEIALGAALAFMSGVCGRCYNISGSGLNQYIVLVAETGTGKDGARDGINKMFNLARQHVPAANFLGPKFASGQSLINNFNEQKCFVSILDEFGLTLKNISSPHASYAQVTFRQFLMDVYGQCGWGKEMSKTVYADKEKNTKNIKSPSLTILGLTTPSSLFDNLNIKDVEEGLASRLTIIEYKGKRTAHNEKHGLLPSPTLLKSVIELMTVAITTEKNDVVSEINKTDEAKYMLDAYNVKCDEVINNTNSKVEKGLYNRAYLKSLKLAGILAVGCNPHEPMITKDLAQWAIDFIDNEVRATCKRFNKGDVGTGDDKQLNDLRHVIKSYFNSDKLELCKKYNIKQIFIENKIIPYGYFSKRTPGIASFSNNQKGPTDTLKRTLQTLIDSGELEEIPKLEMRVKCNSGGRGFMITDEFKFKD